MDLATQLSGESAERDRLCICGEPRKRHFLRCRDAACRGHATATQRGYKCGYCAGDVHGAASPLSGGEVDCSVYRATDDFATGRSADAAAAYKAAGESEHSSR